MVLRGVFCNPFAQEGGQLPFAVVAGDDCHTFDFRNFSRFQLGVAAGDEYVGLRIAAMERADGLAAFLVGQFGDAAGVDNYYVGSFPFTGAHNPLIGKGAGHCRCLCEVEFAPESVEHRLEGAESAVIDHGVGIEVRSGWKSDKSARRGIISVER